MKLELIASCLLFTGILAQGGSLPQVGNDNPFAGYNCDPSKCKLPECRCASKDPPVADPPQFLMLTYDDSIQASTYPQASALFKDRKNPNGCAAKATWFTQVFYSDPFLATQWYAQGNEIADHSVTHSAPFSGSYEEVEGFRAWANSLAGIPRGKIKGFRHPLRNYSVESLDMLGKMGFEWDSSLSASPNERIWPYTMDNGVVTDCGGILSACGKSVSAKGLWEVPMYTVEAASGIELMDIFNSPTLDKPMTPEQVTDAYKTTFDRHMQSGHVPFGVYLHPVWIGPAQGTAIPEGKDKGAALAAFLDYAMSQPNVWMVTPSQVVEYMKNPVSASELGKQSYMQCNPQPAPPTNICNGLGTTGLDICNLSNGTMRTCYGCPNEYPSLINPSPNKTTTKCPVPDDCDTLYWDPSGCECLCTSPSCAWKDTSRPIQLNKKDFEGFKDPEETGTGKSKNSAQPVSFGMTLTLFLVALAAWVV